MSIHMDEDYTPEQELETTKDFLVRLVYGDDYFYRIDMNILDMLHEDDKTTLPLAMELLHTGADFARSEARKVLITAFGQLRGAADLFPGQLDVWRKDYSQEMSPNLKHRLIAAWTLGGLRSEFLGGMDTFFLSRVVRSLDGKLRPLNDAVDRPSDRPYWRGVCLLAIQGVKAESMPVEMMRGFACWIGGIADYQRVMRLARERNTFDADVLRPVLEEQDRTTPALQTGTL